MIGIQTEVFGSNPLNTAFCEPAGADFWPLQVCQYTDYATRFFTAGTNKCIAMRLLFVCAVREIQTEHINTRRDHLLDHFRCT